MKVTIEHQTVLMISKMLEMPAERVRKALETEFSEAQNTTMFIPVKEVMEVTDWSYSTLRRRCNEYDIELVPTVGWKNKRSICVQEFEEKTGIILQQREVVK